MNFDLKKEDFEAAQFNMLVEILATVKANQQAIIELWAKQNGIGIQEAKKKIEKLIELNRKEIDEKLDADYGSIDTEFLK